MQSLSNLKHIVLAGPRNAGKSSLLNSLLEQEAAIVSDCPGTTTDPVTRQMELGHLGAVKITDTAGIDDLGKLGALRMDKSKDRLMTSDLVLVVLPIHTPPSKEEKSLVRELESRSRDFRIVFSHGDLTPNRRKTALFEKFRPIVIDNLSQKGIKNLKKSLSEINRHGKQEMTPLENMVKEGDLIVLVTPIDLAAPKGRLITPQVETIRDALDRDCSVIVVKERELSQTLSRLSVPPELVVTDSQEFNKVAADLPMDQPLTSFSILFARKKGDLEQFIHGLEALKHISAGDKILIMESCRHHRQADDIGTVKIPRLFRQLVSAQVEFDFTRDLQEQPDLQEYDLIIHCGSCMLTRTAMMSRLSDIKDIGVPVINYGIFLAWANGLIPRALQPIPEAVTLLTPSR